MADHKLTHDDYTTANFPIWCPGCGDFAILYAIKRCLASLDIRPSQALLFTGIGCSSRLPGFLNAYGINGVHGRCLPVAMGAKIANPDLFVMASGGDGDGLSIGAGHFVHACRRNLDVVYIMMQNYIYGLTKGQPSPSTETGHVTAASPFGSTEYPVNSVALAITSGATFVARAFAGNPDQLNDIIEASFKHTLAGKGFAFVEAISPCVTYHDTYYYRDFIEDIPPKHDPHNAIKAYELALKTEKQAIGILYQTEKPTLLDMLNANAQKAKKMKLEQLIGNYTWR